MDYKDTLMKYHFFMETIKFRIDYVREMSEINISYINSLGNISPEVIEYNKAGVFNCITRIESSALQIRMIIETIALLSLLVHKDINPSETKKLKNEYRAGKIINSLSKIHEHFFPIPVRQHTDPNNASITTKHTFDVTEAIKKDELLEAYWKCGDMLHMGKLEKIENQTVFNKDVMFIGKTINGIIKLLIHHRILLKKENKYIRCILASRQNHENVSVHIIDGDIGSENPDEKIFLKMF